MSARHRRRDEDAAAAAREAAVPGFIGPLARGVAGLGGAIVRATSPQRAGLAFVAGAMSVLAMAPFFLSPVLFVTLPVLVWLIDGACRHGKEDGSAAGEGRAGAPAERRAIDRDVLARAGIAGWFFGLGYFIFGLFWVGEAFLVEAEKFAWALPAAVTLLPAGLAFFFAAAAIGARALWRPGLARVVMLALLLGLAEWLRGHILTGLPWNTLGYALTAPTVLMQSAGFVGIYGLTLLTVIVFAAPLVTLGDAGGGTGGMAGRGDAKDEPTTAASRIGALMGTIVAFTILAVLTGYGTWRLAAAGEAADDRAAMAAGVKLRIVQPSVPQRDKWRRDKQREIFDLHLELSRTSPDGVRDDLAGITHVVWPEAAMPFLPLDSSEALAEIGAMLPEGVHLLSGALRVERAQGGAGGADVPREKTAAPGAPVKVYNSLMVFGPGGGLVALYDKIHLVPFGEYLPLQGLLERIGLEQLTRIRGGFATGRAPRPLIDVPGLPPFVGLICYEAIFPAAVVQSGERPGLILNVTNDGWFGNTTGPRQHLHMARVRAVEEGLPLVRAANNGISALIDPLGRIRGRLDLDRRGVLDAELPHAASPPLYANVGDSIYWAASMMLMALWLLASRRRS